MCLVACMYIYLYIYTFTYIYIGEFCKSEYDRSSHMYMHNGLEVTDVFAWQALSDLPSSPVDKGKKVGTACLTCLHIFLFFFFAFFRMPWGEGRKGWPARTTVRVSTSFCSPVQEMSKVKTVVPQAKTASNYS